MSDDVISRQIGDIIAAIADGVTNGEATTAIMEIVRAERLRSRLLGSCDDQRASAPVITKDSMTTAYLEHALPSLEGVRLIPIISGPEINAGDLIREVVALRAAAPVALKSEVEIASAIRRAKTMHEVEHGRLDEVDLCRLAARAVIALHKGDGE